MINNYYEIEEFAFISGLAKAPVLLQFSKRKKDCNENSTVLRRIERNILNVDMRLVSAFCEDNQCRCYIMFMDSFITKLINGTSQKLPDFINSISEKYLKAVGIHLIDVDKPNETEDVIIHDWLYGNGISLIREFPTKTGKSIVFKGPTDLLFKYESELGDKINIKTNQPHTTAYINLYIPDFIYD